ncbi:glycosyltransferase [Mycolicibacterium moriokaense]|uniref:4,4'-diaponeurosporenoate glycosyltransferase n=1 Tax=Mycolicibacterium moriokaense TaxID=39691 RepID=A0A318HQ77_9MYCO|nr:glycosyltransferase [Mycolicibacterium moriokaense]PXX09187.1 glycosyl transferase family 2 [Mycolicibacterium moriokaense]
MTELEQAVVVVPAHNELDHLPGCLLALTTASRRLSMPVLVVVVLDACDDGSDSLAEQFGPDVHFISVDAGNVGAARAAGFEYARSACGSVVPTRTWFATTDADSVVSSEWLARMTAADADMVLGTVRIPVWRLPVDVARRYLLAYKAKGPGHNHIHGANMGFRADAYWQVGGFQALATGEDVDLVQRFETAHMQIQRDARLMVTTSVRQVGRAPGGFAHHLRELSGSVRRRQAKAQA